MHQYDRSRHTPPPIVFDKRWEQLITEAAEFYRLPEKAKSQTRHTFQDPNEIPELKEALIAEFHGKCAYTEAPLSFEDCVIIRHRPRMGAIGLNNATARDHYWWLAYEWRNLIPVLPECARAKGHYFPVSGERAEPETPLEKVLEMEHPIFPDPGDPAHRFMLRFDDDGRVLPDTEEELMTVELLGLNLDRVVEGRRKALEYMRAFWEGPCQYDPVRVLEEMLTVAGDFIECRIQWLQRVLVEEVSRDSEVLHRIGEHVKKLDQESYPKGRLLRMCEDLEEFVFREEPESVEIERISPVKTAAPEKSAPLVQKITINRIEIKNFRGIDEMVLELPQKDTGSPNGLMILGENGSGKSSILQAVALALEKPAELSQHPFLRVNKVLRRGEAAGYVKLFLVDHKEPIHVTFGENSSEFDVQRPREMPAYYLRAYGPHRLRPQADAGAGARVKRPAVANKNLWDPYESLVDAEQWILQLPENAFNAFALALKDLLNLREDGFVSRDIASNQLYFDIGEQQMALEDLSSGYQSIITTAADIIAGYPIAATDMTTAPGIVMIDEIGAHLHPGWRMRIVSAYRKTFSNIQFITTTHEPLCLRGVRQEEIVVLQRDKRRVTQLANLPNIEQLRIDQILTSPVFGMNTTVDPLVEEQFTEYYRLIALSRPTQEERARADELKHILYRYGVLGTDRRSRAIYDLIDKDLALQPRFDLGQPVSEETRKRVLDLWSHSLFQTEK